MAQYTPGMGTLPPLPGTRGLQPYTPLGVQPTSKGRIDDLLADIEGRINAPDEDPAALLKAQSEARQRLDTLYQQLPALEGQYGTQLEASQSGMSAADLNARLANRQAGLQARIAAMRAMPSPVYTPPSLEAPPESNLPTTAPTYQKPSAEPISLFAAGLLGLIAPQHAGEFGAEALHGSIVRAENDYRKSQEAFQQDFQLRQARYEQDLRRREFTNKQKLEQSQYAYETEVAKQQRGMLQSEAALREEELTGEQKDYGLYATAEEARGKAKAGATSVLERITTGRQEIGRLETQVTSLERAIEAARSAREKAKLQAALSEIKSRISMRGQDISEQRPTVVPPGGTVIQRGFGGVQPSYTSPPLPKFAPEGSTPVDARTGRQIAPKLPKTTAPQSRTASANLAYRQHHNNAVNAYNQLKALGATQPGGSGTSDHATAVRIRQLWDEYYLEKRLADEAAASLQGGETSAPKPKSSSDPLGIR